MCIDKKEYKMKFPIIDEEKCVGCGICVDTCPKNVIEIVENVAKAVRVKECDGCDACAESCPNDAIQMKEI